MGCPRIKSRADAAAGRQRVDGFEQAGAAWATSRSIPGRATRPRADRSDWHFERQPGERGSRRLLEVFAATPADAGNRPNPSWRTSGATIYGFFVGWGTLAWSTPAWRIAMDRSGITVVLLSLLLGPVATFFWWRLSPADRLLTRRLIAVMASGVRNQDRVFGRGEKSPG